MMSIAAWASIAACTTAVHAPDGRHGYWQRQAASDIDNRLHERRPASPPNASLLEPEPGPAVTKSAGLTLGTAPTPMHTHCEAVVVMQAALEQSVRAAWCKRT